MNRGWMLPMITAALLLAFGAVPAVAAQGIVHHLPAYGELHDVVEAGEGKTIIVSGVPGERSVIRLDPRPPHAALAWVLTVMQAGEPTHTWVGGKDQTLRTDELQFGDDGALAVIVRTPGATGGKFVLRASSKLPAGFRHPDVLQVPSDTSPDGQFEVATWLRAAMDLRVTLHFPAGGGITGGQDPDCSAGFEVTPPPLAGAPLFHAFPVPDPPWPKTLLHSWDAGSFEHVIYTAQSACGIEAVTARVRRTHVVIGKPPKHPNLGPAAKVPWMVQSDALDVHPGGQVKLSGSIKKPECDDATVSRTLRAWLTSPHASSEAAPSGLDLTGPVELTFTQAPMPFELDVTVPPDVAPGLYGLQLLIGTPGQFDPCNDAPLPPPAALPLRVLEP